MPLRDTPFLDSIARGPLVFDGAMGSQLYERGYFITRSFDEANLARPDLVLETYIGAGEMEAALTAARALYSGPIVAQMSFSEERPSIDGLPPSLVADFLRDRGADVVGVNCAEGPAFVFEVAREMLGHGRPVSAQPNAGRPRRLDERTIYMTTPEYFGVYARRLFQSGVALVGGCCGTGPEHIRRIVDAAAMLSGGRVKVEETSKTAPV